MDVFASSQRGSRRNFAQPCRDRLFMTMFLFPASPHEGLFRILIHAWNIARYYFVYLDDGNC